MATKKKAPARAPRKKASSQLQSLEAPLAAAPAPVSPASGSSFGVRAVLMVAICAFVGWRLVTRVRTVPIKADYKNVIATIGSAPEQVVGCRTMTVDKDGNIFYYFVGRLKKFSPDGKLLAFPVGKGKPEQMYPYMSLWALCPDQEGGVWACDRGNSRLLHFDGKLKMDKAIKVSDADLTGLAIDSQGHFLVASQNSYVQVLDADGKPLYKVGNDIIGQAYRVVVDEQDNVYVLDRANCNGHALEDPTVFSFDKKGKELAHWKATGLAWNDFSCMAYDPQGYIALNNNGIGTSPGVALYDKKGDARFVVTAAGGVSLGAITGLAISSNGDWDVDASPVGRGCERMSLPVLADKK